MAKKMMKVRTKEEPGDEKVEVKRPLQEVVQKMMVWQARLGPN